MDSYVELTKGTVYDHSNGGQYKCLGKTESGTLMERVSDGWTLVAHGTRMDENGLICWNYSTTMAADIITRVGRLLVPGRPPGITTIRRLVSMVWRAMCGSGSAASA